MPSPPQESKGSSGDPPDEPPEQPRALSGWQAPLDLDPDNLPETIRVAVLHISPRTAEKIRRVHHLEPDDVRDEVQCVEGLTFVWDYSEAQGGWRAIVEVAHRRGTMLIVLFPTSEEDTWNLGSAYFD
jgi:hypothetical protein